MNKLNLVAKVFFGLLALAFVTAMNVIWTRAILDGQIFATVLLLLVGVSILGVILLENEKKKK